VEIEQGKHVGHRKDDSSEKQYVEHYGLSNRISRRGQYPTSYSIISGKHHGVLTLSVIY
jgi:hypothetical protein